LEPQRDLTFGDHQEKLRMERRQDRDDEAVGTGTGQMPVGWALPGHRFDHELGGVGAPHGRRSRSTRRDPIGDRVEGVSGAPDQVESVVFVGKPSERVRCCGIGEVAEDVEGRSGNGADRIREKFRDPRCCLGVGGFRQLQRCPLTHVLVR